MPTFLLVFIFIKVCLSLETGPGVCVDRDNGSLYCCANFEQINSSCVACKDGFRSNSGNRCKICEDGFYGEKCINECRCSFHERCHHVRGCIQRETQTSITQGGTDNLQTTIINDEQTGRRDSSFTTTLNDKLTVATSHNVTEHNIEGGLNISEWQIYSAAVTVVVVLVWLGLVFQRCRKRAKNRMNIPPENQEQNEAPQVSDSESEQSNNDDYIDNGPVYHSIDESQMIDITVKDNTYLDVVDESSNSTSTMSQEEDTRSYVHPYHGLVTPVDVHPYDSDKQQFDKKSDMSDNKEDTDGYLIPETSKYLSMNDLTLRSVTVPGTSNNIKDLRKCNVKLDSRSCSKSNTM